MRSQLLAILGISSVLLGIYILVISLLNIQQKTPQYHIGCYLSNHVSDYSFKFRTKLNQLKQRGEASRNLEVNIKNNKLVDLHLHKKAVDLTKNVQKYIQKLVLVEQYQQNNAEFFAELTLARKNYQDCARYLNSNFDSSNCRLLWNQYSRCLNDYTLEKQNLDSIHSQRNQILSKIQRVMTLSPQDNTSFNLEEQLRKLKDKYDIQNKENDKNKEKFISQLKRLQIINQTKANEYDEIQHTIEHSHIRYESCIKNIKEFKNCQQISRRLSEYGHSQSWDTLQKRILSKRQSLMKLQQLEVQSRGYGDSKAIKELSEKRNQELKELMRLRIIMDTQQTTQCGCDQKTILKYKQQLQNSKIIKAALLKQMRQLDSSITAAGISVRQTHRERQKFINRFRQQTQALKSTQGPSIVNFQQLLLRLNRELAEVNSQIIDFGRIMNSAQFKCNQFKDRLSLHIVSFEAISKCFSQKDFYDKLRSKAQLILKRDDASSLEYKQNIVRLLQSVTYPKAIKYEKTQNQAEQIQKLQILSLKPSQLEQQTRISQDNHVIQTDQENIGIQKFQDRSQVVYEKVTIQVEEVLTRQGYQF